MTLPSDELIPIYIQKAAKEAEDKARKQKEVLVSNYYDDNFAVFECIMKKNTISD